MTIPSYWQSHLDSKVDTIKSKQGSDKFNFGFITDMHMHVNVGGSGSLLDYVNNQVDMPFIINGGDAVDNNSTSTKEWAISEIDAMFAALSPVKDKTLFTMGNHDDNSITNNWDQTLIDSELFTRLFSYLSGKVTAGVSGKYYFIDDAANKVRYIILDSIDIPYIKNPDNSLKYAGQHVYAFRQQQLTWFANVALDMPANDWYVVVCSHVPPTGTGVVGYDYDIRNADMALGILKAFKNRSSVNMSSQPIVETDFKATINKSYEGKGGNVVCWLSGHVHYDNLITTAEGIKLITTTPDSLYTWADGPTKTQGTISEQAFDIFTVDKETNTGYITRVGAGSDRQFSFTVTPPTAPPVPPQPLPELPGPDFKVPNTGSNLIHILDSKTDEIIGTLNSSKAEYWDATRHDSLDAENTFDFLANATLQKSSLLEKRNRLLIKDEDGYFREYIIIYAEQYKRNEKDVRSNASFADLAKAKVIEPQTLTGATTSTGVSLALDGTEWQAGDIEYSGTQTIEIKEYTNPLALLKLVASTFELEISFRIVVDGNRVIARIVDMKKQIAGFEGKEITFGKDLVGVKRKEDSNQIVTALLGVGPEKDDGTRLTVLVSDDDAFQRWARNGQHLIEPYEPESTDEDMTQYRLQELTENELKKRIDAIVEYECDAVSLEHIFGREHEKIRIGQTVRIKDEGYQPPLYVEGRIQEVDVDQATHQIKSFKIGNFVEFKKSDLENQIKWLKDLLSQKVSQTFVQNYAEKKKVLSDTPPEDTSVIWVKPDPDKTVNIAHTYVGTDWVPLTTTNARDIVEGEMAFERLKGGVMTLGGPENGNGQLVVLDENGEVIADLDAAQGGFDKLWVGELISPSIPNINTANINYYVDPAGDDNADGLTWATAKKTIQACIDIIPKFNDGDITIYCKAPLANTRQNFYGNVILNGFNGSGTVTIEGQDWYNYINGRVQVRGCTNSVYIKNFTINLTEVSSNAVWAYASTYIYCEKVWVYGQGSTAAFYASSGANLQLTQCEAYDCSFVVQSNYLAKIFVDRCKGYGTTRGLVAQWSGIIMVYSTYPGGGTSNTYNDSAGEITLNSAIVDNGAKGTPPAQQYTVQVTQASVNSWTEYYSTWANEGSVKQGKWSGTVGNYRGIWFFGTKILDTIGSGKTIKAMRVWFQRASSSGSSGKVRHSIRAHQYASQPSTIPFLSNEIGAVDLAWGEGAWVNIDPGYWGYFADGTYKGIALYTDDGSNYSKCNPDCWIEITYQ